MTLFAGFNPLQGFHSFQPEMIFSGLLFSLLLCFNPLQGFHSFQLYPLLLFLSPAQRFNPLQGFHSFQLDEREKEL